MKTTSFSHTSRAGTRLDTRTEVRTERLKPFENVVSVLMSFCLSLRMITLRDTLYCITHYLSLRSSECPTSMEESPTEKSSRTTRSTLHFIIHRLLTLSCFGRVVLCEPFRSTVSCQVISQFLFDDTELVPSAYANLLSSVIRTHSFPQVTNRSARRLITKYRPECPASQMFRSQCELSLRAALPVRQSFEVRCSQTIEPV